jgi:hypothetical protein
MENGVNAPAVNETKYDETNMKILRYGHLNIMAHPYTDDSHIKGTSYQFYSQ